MRNPQTTLLGAASGLALFVAIVLPANAMPSFAPSGAPSTGLRELVKSGGGGGGGGAHFGAIGGGGGMGGGRVGGSMGMHSAPHMGNSFAHISGGNGGHIARADVGHIARGGDFNGGFGRHARSFANNWNGNNWNGNWNANHHHHHFNRFYAYPFFYGDYYAYSGDYGSCNYLYRRAVRSNSAYWWNRYYACIG